MTRGVKPGQVDVRTVALCALAGARSPMTTAEVHLLLEAWGYRYTLNGTRDAITSLRRSELAETAGDRGARPARYRASDLGLEAVHAYRRTMRTLLQLSDRRRADEGDAGRALTILPDSG